MGAPPETARWPPAWLTNVGVVIALGIVVLLSSMAIAAAGTTMTEHGVSIEDFQFAGTSAKAKSAYDELGHDGRRAAWWFLAFELPFMAGYGLLLAAGPAFAAGRLAAAGAERLARFARFASVFGLLAAACDLIQNTGLVFVLSGHFGQPAPRIAVVFGDLTWVFGVSAGIVFFGGWALATRLESRS